MKIKKQKENKTKNEKLKKHINININFTIVAIVLIAIFCICVTPITLQNDTYYTIKIGELIKNNGIDMMDHFSWHENLSYTYPHWGYDLITYYIYSAFGMTSIYVVTCILSAILGITIYIVNTKLVKNKVLSFLITIGAMYVIRGYIAARAQLVTFILFALTILFIEKFLETKKKIYAVALIIIPIIIANIHLAVFPFYFILYLPYIAEYIIAILGEIVIYRKLKIQKIKLKIKRLSKDNKNQEKVEKSKEDLNKLNEKVDKIKIKRSKNLQNPYKIKLTKNDNVKWLILIMVICIFTGLLTPLGDTPYTYLFKTLQGNTTQNINEHLPMTLSNESEACCCLILFLAPLIFTKVKIRLSDLFMISGLCFLMLASRRQITMFVIVGSVILNRLITQLIVIYNDEKYIENMEKRFTNVRAGRANPRILDGVKVKYYGVETPLVQLATISVPEARQLVIKPFDKSCISDIERGIYEANIGLTPNNNGEVVMLVIPELTEDRRKEYVKEVKTMAEEAKIALRNVRQDANNDIKKLELPLDEEKRGMERIQDLISKYNKDIDSLLAEKEKELMTV